MATPATPTRSATCCSPAAATRHARELESNDGNTSEYIRDLVRRDHEEQARRRLRDLIEEGLASGPGRRRTKADEKELLAIARGEID
jgi:antitoxin ParD1/3/4